MDEIKNYMRQIADYPILTKGQETELFMKIRGTDQKAAEKATEELVKCNLKLVVTCVKKYNNCGVSFADVIQEGNLGLMKAIGKFDPNENVKFSTFATYWIRQGVSRYIKKHAKTVFIPEHLMNMTIKVKRVQRELFAEKGRDPTIAEISKKSGFSERQVKDAMEYAQQVTSLHVKVGDEDTEYGELLPDTKSADPSDATSAGLIDEKIITCMECLTPREHETLEYKYGIGTKPRTVDELSRLWNVPDSEIRELTRKAFDDMKIRKNDIPEWAFA